MVKKITSLFAGLFLCALFTSCGNLGYSVVLWNNPEAGVSEGQIVKVYVKSNISHTYIIGVPQTKKKVEIPLWQISDPAGKGKANKLVAKYGEYAHTYASVKLDGLPIRASTVNGAKQVYRLRKGEVIRVLYQGTGVKPTNGRGELPGEWLRVLTGAGTQGWCYSYNLSLFERVSDDLSASVAAEKSDEGTDEKLAAVLSRKWYPEEFLDMIRTGRYDLDRFDENAGFDFDWPVDTTDEEGNVIPATPKDVHNATLRTADISKNWSYEKLNKTDDDVYQLDDISVTVTLRGKNTIAVQYMDSDGKMKNENFIALEENVKELAEKEMARRQEELKKIASLGPVFQSPNYGTITFNNENNITWKNYQLLVPSIISSSALGSASVNINYYLSSQLKKEFDGILTIHFVGMEKPVNFFYKIDNGGLRLEDAAKAQIKDNVANGRGSSPLVMFFSLK